MTQTELAATPVAARPGKVPAYLMLGAAAFAVLGSFLPWAKVTVGDLGSSTVNGMDGDGKLTLALAAAVGVLGWFQMVKGRHAGRLIGAMACSAIALVIGLVDVRDVNRVADAGLPGFGVEVSTGIGLWLVTVAAAVMLGGAVLAFRERSSA